VTVTSVERTPEPHPPFAVSANYNVLVYEFLLVAVNVLTSLYCVALEIESVKECKFR
jgi:hypothetical protein